MTSELARMTVNEMWKDGLAPTVDDIVRLNALGLKAENGDGSDGFDYLPRMAFLGDIVFTEPTIAKRIWLDTAFALLADDYTTRLFLTAFALGSKDADLPPCNSVSAVRDAVNAFKERELLVYTESEIVGAVNYALSGAEPSTDEEPDRPKRKSPKDVPFGLRSVARHVLHEALASGVGYDSAMTDTKEHVEAMTALALAAKNGPEFVKSLKLQYIGEFNLTADNIRARLVAEKEENGQAEH